MNEGDHERTDPEDLEQIPTMHDQTLDFANSTVKRVEDQAFLTAGPQIEALQLIMRDDETYDLPTRLAAARELRAVVAGIDLFGLVRTRLNQDR